MTQLRLNRNESIRILGLMTGSSADGLDICLVEFSGNKKYPDYKVLYATEISYPSEFHKSFLRPLTLEQQEINELDHKLGQWFAEEINKLKLSFDVIASHGQTIKHEPPKFTLQIGHPKYMADKFKVPVIYDFRTADIKLGGQGAPLIPIVDRLLFQNNQNDILALNIGGIANLTVIPSSSNPNPLLAWDTGPGNTLIDRAVRLFTHGELAYDPEGSFAAGGKLDIELLRYLLKHEFYVITPPRSAGQEQFGSLYFERLLKQYHPDNEQDYLNFIFTLTTLTVKTISDSVLKLSDLYKPKIIYVGGGGFYNHTLMDLLGKELPNLVIRPVLHKGVNESNKEAFGFAYLGYLHLSGQPGNIPSVTGAKQQTILGQVRLPMIPSPVNLIKKSGS